VDKNIAGARAIFNGKSKNAVTC